MKYSLNIGITYALMAAGLFGASTPLAKTLIEQTPPILLAGFLYLGSGLGLTTIIIGRSLFTSTKNRSDYLKRNDIPWFGGAVLFGGIIAPALLMIGLINTPASTTSLLLNLEGVLTALLAWFVFRENFDRRIAFGMVSIVLGSILLSWQQLPESGGLLGIGAISAACLCWAIDNNLTRKVSGSDPFQIAGIKGLVSGVVNLILAFCVGANISGLFTILSALFIGFLGYGLSLVLFVLALRHLGTARTGAYFSFAPFVGASFSLIIFQQTPELIFILGAIFMIVGLWLHLTENHEHIHTHTPLTHNHAHVHDEHHQHTHDFPWHSDQPHSHEHHHEILTHKHKHFPDIHHQHEHRD